jgi:hypothetical protein
MAQSIGAAAVAPVQQAASDRAPTFFGILLICVAIIAAYALATGRLQATWNAIRGVAETAAGNGTAASTTAAPAAVAGAAPQIVSGTPTPAPTTGTFADYYTAQNAATPQVIGSDQVSYPTSAPALNYGTAPSVSTALSVYGAGVGNVAQAQTQNSSSSPAPTSSTTVLT